MFKNNKTYDPGFKLALLHPKFWLSWIGLFILLLLGFIPPIVRDPIAKICGRVVKRISSYQVQIARINLELCFPEKTPEQIDALIQHNIDNFVITLVSSAELLIRSEAHIKRRVNLQGLEHVHGAQQAGQPIIFIMPHVWAADYAGIRLNFETPMTTMMNAHRNELFTWINNRIRGRFVHKRNGRMYFREAGIRALLKELKTGTSFFYLPDEDHGPTKSVFSPFFDISKATLPAVGRLSQAGNAQVLPVKIGYNSCHKRFDLTVMPAIAPAKMEGKENEARSLNEVVEETIRAYPEQYMWFIKIFKSRPKGETSFYPRKQKANTKK